MTQERTAEVAVAVVAETEALQRLEVIQQQVRDPQAEHQAARDLHTAARAVVVREVQDQTVLLQHSEREARDCRTPYRGVLWYTAREAMADDLILVAGE